MQSSLTTPIQGRDQPEEQQEVASPVLYDLGTVFYELELSALILKGQISQEHQIDNMSALVTSTPSIKEQMQELQRRLEENEAEIAKLETRLENREREKNNDADSSNTVVT